MRTSVSVVIPARNEAATVGATVAAVVTAGVAGEVIVVNDGSGDATAAVASAAGATVIAAGPDGPGKGQALRRGVEAATGEVVVFLDADLTSFDPRWVTALTGALVADPRLRLVKAAYLRGGAGGRVTELTARPALDLLFPELAHLRQPLAGEYAAWRPVLAELAFVHGYGVDLGLVLDVAARYGSHTVGEVDLGVRHHRNRPLHELGAQAREVLAVALARAGVSGATVEESPPLRGLRRLGGLTGPADVRAGNGR